MERASSIDRTNARREKALAIIKGIKPKPESVPEDHLSGLSHTHVPLRAGQIADGVVYFAYCVGRIKIGFTTNVADRMASLATSSPFPVTLLLTLPGTVADEQMYHNMFEEDRANLEWFDLSFRLEDFLMSYFESGTFELLMEAKFDCHDYFLKQADIVRDIMSICP